MIFLNVFVAPSGRIPAFGDRAFPFATKQRTKRRQNFFNFAARHSKQMETDNNKVVSLSLSCLHIFSAVTERKGGGTCAIEYRDQPDSDQPKNPHKLRKINTTGAFGFRGDDPGSRLPRLHKRRRRPLLLPLSSYQRRR